MIPLNIRPLSAHINTENVCPRQTVTPPHTLLIKKLFELKYIFISLIKIILIVQYHGYLKYKNCLIKGGKISVPGTSREESQNFQNSFYVFVLTISLSLPKFLPKYTHISCKESSMFPTFFFPICGLKF